MSDSYIARKKRTQNPSHPNTQPLSMGVLVIQIPHLKKGGSKEKT